MKLKNLLTLALLAASSTTFAQSQIVLPQTNEELSTRYQAKIHRLTGEINAAKAHLKLDKTNAEYKAALTKHEADLKMVKQQKKVADNAIKTQKAYQNAIKKADGLKKKAEDAEKKAAALRASYVD